ncbi:hypothetical protein CMV_012840 [Castanea mollissima]|uniref:Uncharacterized protein n=1 Tax=Castanea mollissima TaxID=60419 RepID=A0A8J4VXC6_9ROSI|nr:hypothetical protein CMV_012840 [Castanea mollissima]
MDGRLSLRCSVALEIDSLAALVIGSFVALVIGSSFALWIALSSTCLIFFIDSLDGIIHPWYFWSMSDSFPADSFGKMSKIKPSDKPKSSVYSKNGKIGLGIRTSLSFFFELPFPVALAIGLSKVSICIILFGMVALAEFSLQDTVKKHGQGQSSSGPAGGSRAGNAGGSIGGGGGGGDENGTIGHGTGQGRRSGIGGGGRGQGNGDDDDNDGRRIVGNVGNGRRPRNPTPEEIAAIFLPIIIQSIANLMSLNDAELSTTGLLLKSMSFNLSSTSTTDYERVARVKVSRLPRPQTPMSHLVEQIKSLSLTPWNKTPRQPG